MRTLAPATAPPSAAIRRSCADTARRSHDGRAHPAHRAAPLGGPVGWAADRRGRRVRPLRQQPAVPVVDGAGRRPARHHAADLAAGPGRRCLAGTSRARQPGRGAGRHHAEATPVAGAADRRGDGDRRRGRLPGHVRRRHAPSGALRRVLSSRRGPDHRPRRAGPGGCGLARAGHRLTVALTTDRPGPRGGRIPRTRRAAERARPLQRPSTGDLAAVSAPAGPARRAVRGADADRAGEPLAGTVAGHRGRHRIGPVRRIPIPHPDRRSRPGPARGRDRGADDAAPARRRLGD